MSKRGVSKELESKIIAAWKNGYTHDMIADKYHVASRSSNGAVQESSESILLYRKEENA